MVKKYLLTITLLYQKYFLSCLIYIYSSKHEIEFKIFILTLGTIFLTCILNL